MNSKVAIVLVNYNGWEDTVECLESLLQQNYPFFTITIVDNASSDNSVQKIKEWAKGNLKHPEPATAPPFFISPVPKPVALNLLHEAAIHNESLPLPGLSEITLIASNQNRGFAAGNNLATQYILIKDPKVPFFWYLNNDTIVPENSLSEMVKYFEDKVNRGLRLGIMGAKLMYYHNPYLIQAVGATYNKWFGTSRHVGQNQLDEGQYDNSPEKNSFDYIVGASMLVSRQYVDEVGLMNPEYFLYFEELDWIIRGKRLGYTYTYCPGSVIYHKEGKSTGGNSNQIEKSYIADFYNIKNRLTITQKYFPQYRFPVYLSLIGAIFNRIKRGQYSRVKMIVDIFFNSLFSSFGK